MVAVGDLALDENLAPLLDPIGGKDLLPIPPAIADIDRRILLAQLIRQQRAATTPVEALRLARQLASALDQLDVEQKSLDDVREHDLTGEMQSHWQSAYGDFLHIAELYAAELATRGQMNPSARRNALLGRFAAALPSDVPVIAAGITTAAPAVAALLRAVSRLPNGMLIWPHVDLDMAQEDWDALGPVKRDEDALPQSEESHPQFHLKLLFDRMGFRREEIERFPGTKANAALTTIDQIFCRADATLHWTELAAADKRLPHARLLSAADSAEEALAIAVLVRQTLECRRNCCAGISRLMIQPGSRWCNCRPRL
jgi:ATP-dependent helicase/nuclease subunit B